MPEQPYLLISFLCALQGVLLSLVFLRKKNNHPASRMLGAYLFIFSLGMLEKFLNENLTGTEGMLTYSFLGFSNFLYGPLLYLFIYYLTVKNPVVKARQLLHFLPFTLFYITDTILILVTAQSLRKDFPLAELILFEILILHLLAYHLLAIRKLKNYEEAILQIHSNLDEQDLRWLQLFVILLTGIYLFSFSITHLIVFGLEEAGQLYVLVQALLTGVVYLMSYRVLFQPALFMLPKPAPAAPSEILSEISAEAAPKKYNRSGLTSSQAEKFAQTLQAYMESEKPYLDPDLTMHTLADKLGISRNHLTEVINEKLGRNFYEFVNGYRVEEVKRLLIEARLDHLNLAAIGLEAGFKSKTAFNTNFKKFTGATPSRWKANSSQNPEIKSKEVLS